MIPKGAIKKDPSKKQIKPVPLILKDNKKKVSAYFRSIYSSYPDVVTTTQAATMTGLHKSTITRLIKKGTLQAINHNQGYVIPKKWLMEFVTSEDYLNFRSCSDKFKNIISGYKSWKMK